MTNLVKSAACIAMVLLCTTGAASASGGLRGQTRRLNMLCGIETAAVKIVVGSGVAVTSGIACAGFDAAATAACELAGGGPEDPFADMCAVALDAALTAACTEAIKDGGKMTASMVDEKLGCGGRRQLKQNVQQQKLQTYTAASTRLRGLAAAPVAVASSYIEINGVSYYRYGAGTRGILGRYGGWGEDGPALNYDIAGPGVKDSPWTGSKAHPNVLTGSAIAVTERDIYSMTGGASVSVKTAKGSVTVDGSWKDSDKARSDMELTNHKLNDIGVLTTWMNGAGSSWLQQQVEIFGHGGCATEYCMKMYVATSVWVLTGTDHESDQACASGRVTAQASGRGGAASGTGTLDVSTSSCADGTWSFGEGTTMAYSVAYPVIQWLGGKWQVLEWTDYNYASS